MKYGATYSTEKHNFGEIQTVFSVSDDWKGYEFHGYKLANEEEVREHLNQKELYSSAEMVFVEANTSEGIVVIDELPDGEMAQSPESFYDALPCVEDAYPQYAKIRKGGAWWNRIADEYGIHHE